MLSRKALICKRGGDRHKAVILIMFLGKLFGLCISSQLGWWYTGKYRQVANRSGSKCSADQSQNRVDLVDMRTVAPSW